MKLKKIIFLLFFALLSCHEGQASFWQRWNPKKLIQTKSKSVVTTQSFYDTVDNVSVHVHEMTVSECKDVFGRSFNVRKNPHDIIPIQVSMANLSPETVVFDKDDLKLKQISTRYLQKKFYVPPSLPFIAGNTVSGALMPTGIALGLTGILFLAFGQIGPFLMAEALAFTFVHVPHYAGKEAKRNMEANRAEQRDLWSTMGRRKYKLRPGQRRIAYAFVKKQNFKKKFALSLLTVERPRRKISFAVQMPPIA